MKALVTGGGGFLGSHLVRALLARGDQVRILARGRYPELTARGVEAIEGDVARAEDADRAAIGVEAVFHAAALPGLFGSHAEFWRVNVGGTERIIDACRRAGVPRLVFSSSPSAVFGDAPLSGADESTPYPTRYLASYPETKAAAERAVLAAHQPGVLHTVALRPHLIFGPGDRHLLPRVIDRARARKLLRVGDGDNLISVVYIDNAVEAHLRALDAIADPSSPAGGKPYFIVEPEPVRLWAFVDRILDGVGVPRPKRSVSYPTARRLGAALELFYRAFRLDGEPRMTRFLAAQLGTAHWFKLDRARVDLGYAPIVDLETAVERTIAALKK